MTHPLVQVAPMPPPPSKPNGKKKNRPQERSDSEEESSEEEIEEIIFIRHGLIGKIIGSGGSKIRSLRAKHGAAIHVEDLQDEGKKRSKVIIRGSTNSVQSAVNELNRLIGEKPYRVKPTGSSPNPKKSKK